MHMMNGNLISNNDINVIKHGNHSHYYVSLVTDQFSINDVFLHYFLLLLVNIRKYYIARTLEEPQLDILVYIINNH